MKALLLLALAACGDNLLPDGAPLGRAANVAIVAHQDDDLLFMQPDQLEAVQRGAGSITVYVTAGNGTKGVAYAEQRGLGVMAAYSAMVDDRAWACGWIEIAGHAAQHCRLAATDVSLVFLNYPDGGKEGEQPASLLHLWEGAIDGADTIARRPAHYDQAGLVDAVAEILATAQPATVRTLEIAATHGRDHSDHMMVGALTVLALAKVQTTAQLIAYRGYNTEDEPVNVIDPLYARSLDSLAHYEACVDGGASCGDAAPVADGAHTVWLHRRYAVGFRASARGALRLDGSTCATANSDGSLALVDCAGAPAWTLVRGGELRLADHCLQALPTGELVVGACGRSVFRLDDDGHLWAGVPPVPAPGMDVDHGSCLGAAGGRVRAVLCGASHIGTWTVEPAQVATARSALGLAATGRAVVLADLDGDGKADLCELGAAGIDCALGRGDGTFAPAASFAPAIPGDAASLVIGVGDVPDQLPGYCVRAAAGVTCSDGAVAGPLWTDAFGDAHAVASTAMSLTAFRHQVCGLANLGVQCAPRGTLGLTATRSTWPAADAPLVIADLDGDQRADWCSLTPAGPACGIAAELDLTDQGVPWSFAQGGAVDVPAGATALGDVDGDGRADLCFVAGATVRCARSQGNGFGPAFVAMTHTAPLVGLWLGDLDGDGIADLCADDGTAILCQRN